MLSPVSEVMIELIQYVAGGVFENNDTINQIGPTHFAITVNNVDNLYAKMILENVPFCLNQLILRTIAKWHGAQRVLILKWSNQWWKMNM